MVNQLITIGIISLLSAVIGALIASKIQSRGLKRASIEHEGWQRAQEANQNSWEVKQRQQALELEQKLTRQVQQIQEAWKRWEAYDEERLAWLTLEQKLAHLPRVEDLPVPSNGHAQAEYTNLYMPHGEPPSFYRADLSGHDLSQRYLAHADLREAHLVNTNFYMADLTGACLSGANLTGANLAGANLTGTDLRNAILTNANLLVADLNGAVLNGSNLLGAHNLTIEQLHSATYNSETKIDKEIELTQPRIANVQLTEMKPVAEPVSIVIDKVMPTPKNTSKRRSKTQ